MAKQKHYYHDYDDGNEGYDQDYRYAIKRHKSNDRREKTRVVYGNQIIRID